MDVVRLLLGGALAATVLAAGPAVGEGTPNEAAEPRRLVQRYDFEDVNDQGVKIARGIALPPGWYATGRDPQSSDPNFLRVPLHGQLAGRAGFPHHNVVRFSRPGDGAPSADEAGEPGEGGGEGFSLHLGLDGGNAGAYVAVGELPAVAGSDYLVTARVRTAGLEHAAARLRCYFLDQEGRVLDGSVHQSARLRTDGAWDRVDLTLPGDVERAAYLGLEVELVQPADTGAGPLGAHQLVLQDVRGDAWFDDIEVWQMPFVQVASQSAVNVVRGPDRPRLDVTVRDVVGDRLAADLRVFDHELRPVAESRRLVEPGAAASWRWEPGLPGYGWFLTELTVSDGGGEAGAGGGAGGGSGGGQPIARTYNAVLWLPPAGGSGGIAGMVTPDEARFALVAEGASDAELALLPELMNRAGLGTATLSAWSESTTRGALDLRVRTLARAVDALTIGGRRVQVSLSPLPDELAAENARGGTAGLSALGLPPARWMAYLHPLMVRLNQQVSGWPLGSPTLPDAAGRGDLPGLTGGASESMRHRTGQSGVVLPWRLDQAARGDLPVGARYEVAWPAGVSPGALAEQLDQGGWAGVRSGGGETVEAGAVIRLHVRPDAADAVGHGARVADLAQRMVYAWEAGAIGTALADAWTPAAERREAVWPDPLLGVMANVADRLVGYRAAGRLNLTHGRTAIIFEHVDRAGDGLLVVFAGDTPASKRRLRLYLGDAPVAVDVWGNAAPLRPVDGEHTVELTETPTFITGIDPILARFRAGFTLDRAFISSTQTAHPRTLRMVNPWPMTVTGRLTITGPAGWTVRPFVHTFSIAPGRTVDLPVDLRFPVNEAAGDKELTAELELTADRAYRVAVSTPLTVGLEGVRFEPTLALEPRPGGAGVDAVVTCIVTNTGERALSLRVAASLPGHPRVERLVPRLEPGGAILRTFRIPDAAAALATGDVQVTLRETDGPAVLNQRVGVTDIE